MENDGNKQMDERRQTQKYENFVERRWKWPTI